MSTKKYIKVETGYSFSGCDLEEPLDKVIEFFQRIKDACIEGMYQNLTIDQVGYDDAYFKVFGERLETDAEFNRRVKKEKAQRERRKKEREKQKEDEIKLRDKLIARHGLPPEDILDG